MEDIIYGDRAFIKITFLKRVGGNVTIKVANETYIQNISYYTGGTGLYIENLDAGEYNVDVTYNGNAIYNSYTKRMTHNFNKKTDITMINIS